MKCVCGHDRVSHNRTDGCLKFLCCTKERNLFPGKRHTEHDGANHKALACRCRAFEEDTRWAQDMEAGAIG